VAYDERLAARVREMLAETVPAAERTMFGGLSFMVNGHMCCGIIRDELVLRLGVVRAQRALGEPHVRPMDFTGRPLKGFVFVSPRVIRTEAMLRHWVQLACDFVETLPPK
jgi:TfoX/Sxy family transcriptional regulator of competence genes